MAGAVLLAIVGASSVPAGAVDEMRPVTARSEEPRRAGPPDVLPAGGRWTVTLLTGEVIDVSSDAEGRPTVAVREHGGPVRTVRHPDGEVHVIPLVATPLLDDVLDPELFNVTGLVRQGYDDEGRDVVPLIVERSAEADVRARVASPGERRLPSIGAVAVGVPKSDTGPTRALIDELAGEEASGARSPRSGVTHVWLDRRVAATRAPGPALGSAVARPVAARPAAARPAQPAPPLDRNLTQIGADDAWAAGLTGAGATVAVLDTGVDASHPDLAGQIDAQENFSDSADAVDHNGHGTHVASLVAGTGAGAAGARSGVAPDARLIVGKVIDDGGYGTESQVIAGMEWAAPRAEVVSMSLGFPAGGDSTPVSTAVDVLSEQHGTLFVVAAGNSGPGSGSVDSPGVADRALTVGAVDGDDVLADFSSRGPVAGSYELKPEVVAPGVDIVAARATGTGMGDPVDARYTSASGTSMATPQVAGAAAVLVQAHPDWDADELKNTIVGSAAPLDDGYDGYDVGSGRVDIGAGAAATVRAGRDVVEASLPHPRTDPHVESLTWANDDDEPVTVRLDAEIEDREGQPVDQVSIEPAELTIAPGASGSATLTVDGPDLGDGLYSGAVTGSAAGGTSVRTPVAVHAVPETADLTITSTPPGGGPAARPETFASIVNLDDYGEFNLYTGFAGDSLTVEVPEGRYAVTGDVFTGDFDEEVVAQVGDPDVTVAGDTTVAFDGAAAVPFAPTVEGVDTAPPMYTAAVTLTTPDAGTAGYPVVSELWSTHPRPPVHLTPMEGDADRFGADQLFRLQAPHLTARTGDEAIAIVDVFRPRQELAGGEHTLTAVDVGAGADLSAARDGLAAVELPADPVERAAVTRRAADAGVALLAFVDERRAHLTLDAFSLDPERLWADVPVVAAAGDSARRLRAAATAGDEVTVTVAPSPYVYDVATPTTNRVDPAPVIDRAEQRRLATLAERFHRDPDGRGATSDSRWSDRYSGPVQSEGRVPERRTSHVTPDMGWLSGAVGPAVSNLPETGERVTRSTALSFGRFEAYQPGSEHQVRWLRRPQWPGPVGDLSGQIGSDCESLPVRHSADHLLVWLRPFQERLDGVGCGRPLEGRLTLQRDGQPVAELPEDQPRPELGAFPVPAEEAEYRLTYEQQGQAPYAHRSTTTWTFRSAAPPGDDDALVPMLVVGYRLPLDTLNRPTGDTATLTVRQMTGADQSSIRQVRAWTSIDGGATWLPAAVHHGQGASYELRLPQAPRGTAVSLRVAARDAAGGTIDQTLYEAYSR